MGTRLQDSTTRIESRGDSRAALVRRVRFLVAFTIAYNLAEAVVSLLAGSVAGSSALLGFGLDSLIEVSSALAVAWQFAGADPEKRERITLRAVALSFFALAGFLTVDSLRGLLGGHAPEHSTVGIVVAALSLVVMPLASYLQRRTGRELGSASAVADSKQTLMCAYMSAVVLVGLVANSVAGWWWADPAAALLIAGLAVREGIEAWRGEACGCGPAESLFATRAGNQAQGQDGSSGAGCGCGPNCDCD